MLVFLPLLVMVGGGIGWLLDKRDEKKVGSKEDKKYIHVILKANGCFECDDNSE